MYQRILVPLDGSELAQVTLSYVEELARTTGCEVVLLRVAEPEENCGDRTHRDYLEGVAEAMLRRQGDKGIVHCEVVRGRPAEEIVRYAEENDIDLIAMSTHGRSGVLRWVMGSVATKVLGASSSPVLLVRAKALQQVTPQGWLGSSILVPLDGSAVAEWVIPHVGYLAREWGAETILLRICEPPTIPSDRPAAIEPSWEAYRDQLIGCCRSQATQYLNTIEKAFEDRGLKARSEVIMGKVAEEIIAYTNRGGIDLIAITTHGRSGVSRWLYGSVASKILSAASIPILLINARVWGIKG